MYNPSYNRVGDAAAYDLVDRARFGHLVSFGNDGFAATSLPMLLARRSGSMGTLRGHVARANAQWRSIDGAEVFVLVALADGYVSPSWYPSKAEHGAVVPTWNYEVVHITGTARVHDDTAWVRGIVSELTDVHESARTDGGEQWAVTDAPGDYIDKQLRAIVGIEIAITRIEGKRKLSQNRSADDQAGVIAGLNASVGTSHHALAHAMSAEH